MEKLFLKMKVLLFVVSLIVSLSCTSGLDEYNTAAQGQVCNDALLPSSCGSGYSCNDPTPVCCPANGGSSSSCCNEACCSLGGNVYQCGTTSGCTEGRCCTAGACCGLSCCLEGSCCLGKCCGSGESCIGGECCPAASSCGLKCCPSSQVCSGGMCQNATWDDCTTCSSCEPACYTRCDNIVAAYSCVSANGIVAPTCLCGQPSSGGGGSGKHSFVGSLWFYIVIGIAGFIVLIAIGAGVTIVIRKRQKERRRNQELYNINSETTPLNRE